MKNGQNLKFEKESQETNNKKKANGNAHENNNINSASFDDNATPKKGKAYGHHLKTN